MTKTYWCLVCTRKKVFWNKSRNLFQCNNCLNFFESHQIKHKLKAKTTSKITQKQIDAEIRFCQLMGKKDWQEDNGLTFRCKACRNYRPINRKSKTKIGKCTLCAPE